MKMAKAMKTISVVVPPVPGLDIALGVGGPPRGRVVEIYGPESRADDAHLRVIAEACRRWRHRRLHRCRNALDPLCRQALGVNIRPPDLPARHRRAGLEIADMLVRSGGGDLLIGSSTRSPRWCPRPKSRAKWATIRPAGPP